MEVNFVTGSPSEIPLRQSSTRSTPAPAAAAAANGTASFEASNSIAASLSQAQSSRPEKIARANELLNDPSYPSGPVLNQLAGFLAQRL